MERCSFLGVTNPEEELPLLVFPDFTFLILTSSKSCDDLNILGTPLLIINRKRPRPSAERKQDVGDVMLKSVSLPSAKLKIVPNMKKPLVEF